jgi:dienelactone hydrolase
MAHVQTVPDPLDDFDRRSITLLGVEKTVFVAGSGPAVIVISEMPGITPEVARFARMVRDAGFTVWMPTLFGTPGKPVSRGYVLLSVGRACISREFAAFSSDRSSPVIDWLRALAAHAHPLCGGKGVGAIGMCFTGNFALSMMLEPAMLAPVLSQPSLPFPIGVGRKRDLGLSDTDLEKVKAKCAAQDLTVLGLRFTGDRAVPRERFERLRQELGDRFVGVEIDSSKGNPYGHRAAAHSVLTEDLQDEPGTPTRDALDQVLELFRSKLLTS